VNVPIDLHWLEAVLLSSVRMAGFLVSAPPFSYRAFPARVKAILALALGLAVSPKVVPEYVQLESTGAFLGAIVAELLLGLVLGFLVYITFAAVQAAGDILDVFGGFQLAQAFDPQSLTNGAQFSRLFYMAALALMLSSDAYQLLLAGLFRSYDAIGIGVGIDLTMPAAQMVDSVTHMFVAALQIAGPLVVVLFLADVGLGLLTRVAPALNAFSLGFPLKILLTVTLGGLVLATLPAVVAALTKVALDAFGSVR
jgi:flagellar biosynthetic protein FliR